MSVPAARIASAYRPAAELAHRLGLRQVRPDQWRGRCPVHEGTSTTSLCVRESETGDALITCFAGCDTAAVVARAGMTLADLFADAGHPPPPRITAFRDPAELPCPPPMDQADRRRLGPIIAEYLYQDATGNVRYRVTRHEPKAFRPWHRDAGGRWILGLGGRAPLPYRMPELLAADPSEPVFVVEGEKDVDVLTALGLVATTNVGGAGKGAPELADALSGRRVVILPDNDAPGQRHAEGLADALQPLAASVRILSLSGLPARGDVSDLLAAGGTVAELRRLAAIAPAWEPTVSSLASSSSSSGSSSWSSPPGRSASPSDPPAPFPTHVFPEALRDYVEAGAAAFGVPADMIAVPLLGFAAAALGTTIAVELKPGWQERPILWLAVVGRPGTGKSPALEYALAPLRALQDAAWRRYELALGAWESAQREAKAGRLLHVDTPATRPEPESFFTTDATVEALARLSGQAAGLVVLRDELIGWVKSHDAYRAGGDRQTHLSLWAGAALKVDRKTSAPLYVPRPCVSVVGGIQPDRLGELRAEAGQDDGFVDRVLASWPDAAPAKWTDASVLPETVAAAERLFARLRHVRTDGISATPRPTAVAALNPEALHAFVCWHDDNAESVAAAQGLAAGCAAKYPRQAARIVAVLHALADPDDLHRPVTAETMTGAIEVIEYFRAHARRVLPALGTAEPSRAAAVEVRVERALGRSGGGWVARTELYRRLGNGVLAEELDTTLAALDAGGRASKRSVPATGGRDREEWRLVPSGASPPMKNEESPAVRPAPSTGDPFLHSSWSGRDGPKGAAAVSGEAFSSVSTRSVAHEETSEDEPGEDWERWEEPL